MEISFRSTYICGYLTVKSGNAEITEDIVLSNHKIDDNLIEQMTDVLFEINSVNEPDDIQILHRMIEGRNLSFEQKKELVSLILNDEE